MPLEYLFPLQKTLRWKKIVLPSQGLCLEIESSPSLEPKLEKLPLDPFLKKSCSKRQKDFKLGRLAAALAMELLNHAPSFLEAAARTPPWPPGLYGSISHSKEKAAVFLTSSKIPLKVGFDIQKIPPTLKHQHLGRILHPSERMQELFPNNLSCKSWVLLFSAKESIYKCLAPPSLCSIQLLSFQEETFHYRLEGSNQERRGFYLLKKNFTYCLSLEEALNC